MSKRKLLSIKEKNLIPQEVDKGVKKLFVQFFFLFFIGETASQVVEIANGVYCADTVTANYEQFWFRRFRSGIFDAPRTGRPFVQNVDKITEIIQVDRHVGSRSIAQELKIDHKSFKPFAQSWIQKEVPCLGATLINTKKNDGSNFHLRSLGQTE
ncbi:histone-lysine N-methyltransferase SETMAR [Trichonephila clavipes]|uniref:Histone-lysine N-methyltransferase SETMAR n=1 Tax=Trichonephila clavipes TaxID=2585209 RepID=A0A8X6S7M3_TRICX|nr:histone-lysine N-methyltransferase SETMAR [Trichonephila clavipes]